MAGHAEHIFFGAGEMTWLIQRQRNISFKLNNAFHAVQRLRNETGPVAPAVKDNTGDGLDARRRDGPPFPHGDNDFIPFQPRPQVVRQALHTLTKRPDIL